MAVQDILFNAFKKNAGLADAKVRRIGSFSEAIAYVSALVSEDASRPGIIAAPELSDAELDDILCKIPATQILQKDLYACSDGIPFAITKAEFGIADTGLP